MKETKTSNAQKRATRKWLNEHMESMNVSLKPGVKDKWKSYAAQSGMPLVRFIEAAIEEKAERDGLVEDMVDEGDPEE